MPGRFPIVFHFRDLIAGRDFVAVVEAWGRLVLAEEDGGWTLYGVNPGGTAGGAEDRTAAFADFRNTYQEVLQDIAADSPDFDAFRSSVEGFVRETSDDVAREWRELHEKVLAGELELEEIEQRNANDYHPRVVLQRIDPPSHRADPGNNSASTFAEAA